MGLDTLENDSRRVAVAVAPPSPPPPTGGRDLQKNKWKASIRVKNVRKHLGTFKTLVEGVDARNKFIRNNKESVSVAETVIKKDL